VKKCFSHLVLVVSNLNIQFKFDPTQENPNKIQIKIQLVTLANYKPKIIDGAKLNLGILGEKHEGILMCCMSTQIQIKFLEIPHFDIKQILRMLQEAYIICFIRPPT
jgi:hypothetical protein